MGAGQGSQSMDISHCALQALAIPPIEANPAARCQRHTILASRVYRQSSRATPEALDKTFTLKELVILLERGPLDGDLGARLAEASRRREAAEADGDLDVADPYGDSLDAYRRIAAEIDGWTQRLVAGLFGPALASAGGR